MIPSCARIARTTCPPRAPFLPSPSSIYTQSLGAEKTAGGDRQPWDLGRFVKTVLFFNKPPSPGELLSALAAAPLKLLQGAASGDMEVGAAEQQRGGKGARRGGRVDAADKQGKVSRHG